VEVWEKVNVSDPEFFKTLHARYGCIACHGGTGDIDDKEAAHEGLVHDPSEGDACATCHRQVVDVQTDSLHTDLEGYHTVLQARSDEAHWDQLMITRHAANATSADPLSWKVAWQQDISSKRRRP
jgi:hypothetical protein